MIRTLTLHLCLLAYSVAHGQFHYNFDDINTLSESQWIGDTDDFIIENSQLRLFSEEAGSSQLFHKSNIPDSAEIHLFFKMDFNPSANNKLRIFLHLDTTLLEIASGYYLEIGENGAEDKISFFRVIGGEALKLAEGSPGHFGEGPVSFYLKTNKNTQGLWQLFSKQQDSLVFQTEFELFDSTIKRYFDQYFGIQCIYTSTRADKFYFDDIYLQEALRDTIPPEISQVKVLSPYQIRLEFTDLLDKNSVLDPGNYRLLPGDLHPLKVGFNEFKPKDIQLEFSAPLLSNTFYQIFIEKIQDIPGNLAQNISSPSFYLAEKPATGDITISEILFDPFEDGQDFIEIYNASQKIISLDGLLLANRQKEGNWKYVENAPDLFPGDYLALTADSNQLHSFYAIPGEAKLFQNLLPSLNNDEGNVSLLFEEQGNWQSIDSFDYNEDMHFQLLKNTEGISLEKIHIELPSTDPANWQSAGTLFGGATPGYRNSQSLEIKTDSSQYFFIENKVFSPDGDGYEDLLSINYQLPEDGFVGTIHIFDSLGNFILKLANNQLLGTRGAVSWDGLNQGGRKGLAGPYLVFCEAFHPDGRVVQEKLIAYLVIPF